VPIFVRTLKPLVGRDGAVCTATHYVLDSPGIESWWGLDFPHPSILVPELIQLSVRRIPGLFPGDKPAKAWRWPPTSSRIKVQVRIDLQVTSPWACTASSRIKLTFFTETTGYNIVSPDTEMESFNNNAAVLQQNVAVAYEEDKDRQSSSQEWA
jgi:hypothetical protein